MDKFITIHPDILGGTPCFAGTRVPVESLFDWLAGGENVDFFLEQFPSVTPEQVAAVLADAKTHATSNADGAA